jgi:type IV pilus assembly protein PilA
MLRSRKQGGFTIIELMIVMMIIGILAAIVLPNIRAYSTRARMSEAILALDRCKGVVTELYQSLGDPPADGEWGCEANDVSQYVSLVTTKNFGTIIAVLRGFNDGRLDSHQISLTPLDNTGSPPTGSDFTIMRWRCGGIPDGTDVLAKYLPNTCRGS